LKERLQKVIASAGIASRRKAERLILESKVSVNGKIVTTLGTKVDLRKDKITLSGNNISQEERTTYLLNKPKGVICTSFDPQRRKRAIDLVKDKKRLYTIGRLDFNSRGLILLSNDGELSYKILHPKHQIEKTYEVVLDKNISQDDLQKLSKGVKIDSRQVFGFSLTKIKANRLRIKIKEGRKRIIRRIFRIFNYKVTDLKRTKIGFLSLGKTKEGEYRKLTEMEVDKLRKIAGFSLLELVASLAIFSVGILTLALLFPAGISETKNTKDYTKAVFLGQAKMEEIKAKTFKEIPSNGTHDNFLSYCEDNTYHQNDYLGFRWLSEVYNGTED
jgi:pseudouridine synthase